MCGISLEEYESRPARTGDRLTLKRFPSLSMGFVDAGGMLACVKHGARLTVSAVAEEDRMLKLLGAEMEFTEQELPPGKGGMYYRDGLKFVQNKPMAEGAEAPPWPALLLQDLCEGFEVEVIFVPGEIASEEIVVVHELIREPVLCTLDF